jgi:enterochelin esterase family protein
MTRSSVLGALALFVLACNTGEIASPPAAPPTGGAPVPAVPSPTPVAPPVTGLVVAPTTGSPDASPEGATRPVAPVPPVAPVGMDPGTEGDGDVTIGPGYTAAPEFTARPGVPKGTMVNFVMKSTDSKFYTGLNGPFNRPVAVYVPSQYVPGTPAPFIVSADGSQWAGRFAAILDNMVADRKLPVMIAININNGGGDSKGSERGLEYDTASGKYAEFVEAEVLPRVEMEAKVKLTTDPNGRATMGGSSGGAAAFSMGWFHPELYHRVMTGQRGEGRIVSPVIRAAKLTDRGLSAQLPRREFGA